MAASLAGKKFVGIEQDPVYFEYACQRIENAYGEIQYLSSSVARCSDRLSMPTFFASYEMPGVRSVWMKLR